MSLSRTFLIAGALVLVATGCAPIPTRDNPWPEPIEVDVAEPVPLPAWPDASQCGDMLCLTPTQAAALNRYADVAEANTEIAGELSAATREHIRAYNGLARAGRAEFELSELRSRLLEEERRARKWDRWGYRLLLALLGAAAVTK